MDHIRKYIKEEFFTDFEKSRLKIYRNGAENVIMSYIYDLKNMALQNAYRENWKLTDSYLCELRDIVKLGQMLDIFNIHELNLLTWSIDQFEQLLIENFDKNIYKNID